MDMIVRDLIEQRRIGLLKFTQHEIDNMDITLMSQLMSKIVVLDVYRNYHNEVVLKCASPYFNPIFEGGYPTYRVIKRVINENVGFRYELVFKKEDII